MIGKISLISYVILFVAWLITFYMYISCRKECNKLLDFNHILDNELARLSEKHQLESAGGIYPDEKSLSSFTADSWNMWKCNNCYKYFLVDKEKHGEVFCPYCGSNMTEMKMSAE